ncbi:phosphotransferase [Streptomyces niveus]|uniref:phosphotransferase n=1 Tax=Streptomyces niveus TaxID=193462 RepID=UPI003722898B
MTARDSPLSRTLIRRSRCAVPCRRTGRRVGRRRQWDRVATRALADFDALHGRLARVRPPSGAPAIVHGDYRLDNTILAPGDYGRIAAIVDWEMATPGDRLADLGMLFMYRDPACAPVLGARHVPTANPGFPTGDELAARHAARSGRDIQFLPYYQAFACFKLAVIAEGIHARYLAGQTVGTGFEHVGSATLRPGGELALVGSGGGQLTVRKPGFLPPGFRVSLPFWGTRPELAEVIALARSGALRVETDHSPLSAAPQAFDRLRRGGVWGRVVLVPD